MNRPGDRRGAGGGQGASCDPDRGGEGEGSAGNRGPTTGAGAASSAGAGASSEVVSSRPKAEAPRGLGFEGSEASGTAGALSSDSIFNRGPRALRGDQRPVRQHAVGRDAVLRPQVRDQPAGRGELGRRGVGLREVPDERHPDAPVVRRGVPRMSPGQLPAPPERGLGGPVRHPLAVADDEVVADAPPRVPGGILAAAVGGVDRGHVAGRGRGVMHDDPTPPAVGHALAAVRPVRGNRSRLEPGARAPAVRRPVSDRDSNRGCLLGGADGRSLRSGLNRFVRFFQRPAAGGSSPRGRPAPPTAGRLRARAPRPRRSRRSPPRGPPGERRGRPSAGRSGGATRAARREKRGAAFGRRGGTLKPVPKAVNGRFRARSGGRIHAARRRRRLRGRGGVCGPGRARTACRGRRAGRSVALPKTSARSGRGPGRTLGAGRPRP